MRLSEFIKQLQRIESQGNGRGNCPVCLADWYFERVLPNERSAEVVTYIETAHYIDRKEEYQKGNFVLIGG